MTSKGSGTQFDIGLSNEDTVGKTLKTESTIMADFPVVIVKGNVLARPDRIKAEKLREVKQKIRELYGI